METKEKVYAGFLMNGFAMLFVHLVLFTALIVYCFWLAEVWSIVISALLTLVWFIMMAGYIQLEPNEARVMVFFGEYKGTFRRTGFFWLNPFMDKKKLLATSTWSLSR